MILEKIAEGTLAITMDDLIASVADVVEAGIPANVHNVQHVEELAKYLVAGTIGAPAFEESATVDGALGLVKTILLDYAAFVEVEAVFN